MSNLNSNTADVEEEGALQCKTTINYDPLESDENEVLEEEEFNEAETVADIAINEEATVFLVKTHMLNVTSVYASIADLSILD